MLDKIRTAPLKVKLSTLFLLALFAVAAWLIPPLAITIVLAVALVYSFVTLLTYWDQT